MNLLVNLLWPWASRLCAWLTVAGLLLALLQENSLQTLAAHPRSFQPVFFHTDLSQPVLSQPLLSQSSGSPTVHYAADTNTVTVGDTDAAQPATEVMTLPTLAAQLTTLGFPALLTSADDRTWLLKANLTIERSARLEVTAATVEWLQLASPPAAPVVVTARQGGHLLLDGVKVTSWDSAAGAVDTSIANGRSYLLAYEGGRMDVLNSEIAYLGAESGEPSGLSWRKRLKDDDPTTGATGRIEDSELHHNYFGMYSYEAYGIKILRNRVHSNLYYGIDPHDYSQAFEVAYNTVYGNGAHGIIFSRHCTNNDIHNNEVFDNAQHGIMLDRGTNDNRVYENIVYGNDDGIAIFQSADNEIYNNTIRENRRGIRINATYDADDPYDGISSNNQLYDNQILDNSEHGIYLYARADRNLIRNNQILRSGANGIYIKSGGNRVAGNTIEGGNVGMTIVGGEYTDDPPEAAPALDPPGTHNVILGTTVAENRDVGIRLLGAGYNQVGGIGEGETGNLIENNGKDGIAIGDATNGAISTDNLVTGNTIRGNTRHGILVTDATSVRNRLSRNSITGNGQLGIKVDQAAQAGLAPPQIATTAQEYIRGTSVPGAQIEIYSDPGDSGNRLLTTVPAALFDPPAHNDGWVRGNSTTAVLRAYSLTDYEGQIYLGTTTADEAGVWSFSLPPTQDPEQVSVLAIDTVGNTSAFSGSLRGGTGATYTVKPDEQGNMTIYVNGIGTTVTLPDIAANLGAADAGLLIAEANGEWRLNANLFLEIGVTLDLKETESVKRLLLRSEASSAMQAAGVDGATAVDHASFVYIRAYNSEINIDGVDIFSWDEAAQDYDRDPENGRAYLLAKYDAVMNIRNAEVGYLGSSDGESYGLVWRDVNDGSEPDLLRTRVTGEVVNSEIHHNYYGIYTFQASDMLFRNNKFYGNVRYGFDPHDFSHDFLVEGNEAYENGAHGFILSRGCNNFTLRNNKSYNNSDPSPSSLAHGFMLDPGSPNSQEPQAPSYENILENNEAYGNEGYGLRVLGSNTNIIRNNNFHGNEMGISIEETSTANGLIDNALNNNLRHGVFIHETAHKNDVLNNAITGNGENGIYIRSNENLVQGNQASDNGKAGISLLIKTGFDAPRDNRIISNTVTSNAENGIDLRNAVGTEVRGNMARENTGDGVYMKDGTINTSLEANCFCLNIGYGIEINGSDTLQNTWSGNQIYANGRGGIAAGGGATLPPMPTLQSLSGTTLAGLSLAGGTVEIFADNGDQGQYFLGRTVADGAGAFRFTYDDTWPAPNLTAIVIGEQGNASDFSEPLVIGTTTTPTPTLTPGTPIPETPTATPTPGSAIYLPYIESSQQ